MMKKYQSANPRNIDLNSYNCAVAAISTLTERMRGFVDISAIIISKIMNLRLIMLKMV
jgi:hypothetical protein